MLNSYFERIDKENTFSKTSERVKEYRDSHPGADIISLGIGDVSFPVIPPVIEAMHKAVDDLSKKESFSGYGNYYGIPSLRKAILDNEYLSFGFTAEEIYVSDGAKSDAANLLELFSRDSRILMGDPTYPIYFNSACALERDVFFTPLDENDVMVIPEEHYDIIYICSPSNPTGNAYSREDLERWVDYALREKAVILYDNVYSSFIRSDRPRSIYEIEGAKNCAIEMRSFSKKASFTGVRCSYYVLPKEIDPKGYWKERTINRFNGASCVAQKGAEASYLEESRRLIKENIEAYHRNTDYLKESFLSLGYEVHGGEDSPFLWVRCKDSMSSQETFEHFLKDLDIIVVPGIIFGKRGDGFFRVSGLGTIENSHRAIARIREFHEKNA